MKRLCSALLVGVLLQGAEPVVCLQPLLGIPYQADGVEDAQGRFVLFSAPNQPLARPGLNCSGFLVAASRRLLGFRGSPETAARDRGNDSGNGASLGQDWDFGLDLILNLSEGHPRRQLFPEGLRSLPAPLSPRNRGFPFGTTSLWDALTPRLSTRAVYLASLSWVKAGRLAHHHVAVILKDNQGRSWFYHTLPRGRVHRLSLDTSKGRARLQQMFGSTQRMFLLEVDPPSSMEGTSVQR